jgi:O-antigen ligase
LWSEWLGTHNSYTQVSSECGIPGFIFYTGVLVMCLRLAYRMYKAARDKPELRDVMALSWCLFCGLVVYAVGTMFFHMAYTGGLPLLSGMTLALWLATKDQLRQKA